MPQRSSSREIELSTCLAVANGRRERTSAMMFVEVELLVSLGMAEAKDVCDVGDVDKVWLGLSGCVD